MKVLIIGASGYLRNTIYKKLKEYSNDDIYGTCNTSKNHEFIQINILPLLFPLIQHTYFLEELLIKNELLFI